MKIKIMFSLMLLFLTSTSMFAVGFPVTRATSTTVENTIDTVENTFEITSPAALKSQKSQGIALVLLLTLGLVAAHRWYLGRLWIYNVFFILTFGGLGIWALADLIGIFAGWMEPKDGRYKKSFF